MKFYINIGSGHIHTESFYVTKILIVATPN